MLQDVNKCKQDAAFRRPCLSEIVTSGSREIERRAASCRLSELRFLPCRPRFLPRNGLGSHFLIFFGPPERGISHGETAHIALRNDPFGVAKRVVSQRGWASFVAQSAPCYVQSVDVQQVVFACPFWPYLPPGRPLAVKTPKMKPFPAFAALPAGNEFLYLLTLCRWRRRREKTSVNFILTPRGIVMSFFFRIFAFINATHKQA